MKVVVICPGGNATGGLEALHQLTFILNQCGQKASLCYWPFNKSWSVPAPYAKYGDSTCFASEIAPGDVVVLPEILTFLLPDFPRQHLVIWWLSVDNFLSSCTWRHTFVNRQWPWRIQSLGKLRRAKNILLHACQSFYAKDFVEKSGLGPALMLTDYLSDEFIATTASQQTAGRDDLILFNPAKGLPKTEQIRALAPDLQFRPLVNLNRAQITELFLHSKCYIDFGQHPGRDRIPRETAACGLVVLTNRRGSAAFDADVPIDPSYKIDDSSPDFAALCVARLRAILADFPAHQARQASYIAWSRSSHALFESEVRALLQFPAFDALRSPAS